MKKTYRQGYLDGLRDQPKRKAACYARKIDPKYLDYPQAARDKITAYATLMDIAKIRQFLDKAKKGGCETVIIAFPEALADNYMDFVVFLSLIAESNLTLSIAEKSPFLTEWGEYFPIFKVPSK